MSTAQRAGADSAGLPVALFVCAIRTELDGRNGDLRTRFRRERTARALKPRRLSDGHCRDRPNGKSLPLNTRAGNEADLGDTDAAGPSLRRRTLRNESQKGEKGENDPLHSGSDIGRR